MAAGQSPTPEKFAEDFRDAIRVGFNWDRFLAEQWPIERVILDSPEMLGQCFTPWYIGTVGHEVPYDAAEAVPMSLRDVPKAAGILCAERRADIQGYVDKFRAESGTIRFAAPTYALPDGGYFVLDRNHRLSALTLCAQPFEVELWNVRGPHETECLLDLTHWLRAKEA